DYRAGTFTMKDLPDKSWMKSERDEQGHFMIDLLGGTGRDADDVMNDGAPIDGDDRSSDSTDKNIKGDSVKGDDGDDGDSSAPDPDAFYLQTRTEFYEIGSDDETLTTEEVMGPERHLMDADTHSDLVLALEQPASDMKDTLRGPRKRLIEVIQFKIEDGWDFSKRAVIRDFLNKIDNDKPDDIFFAPPCKHWCSWQHVNEKISEERAKVRSNVHDPWQRHAIPETHETAASTNKEFIQHMTLARACADDQVILRGKLAQQARNYPRPMARGMAYLIADQGMDIDAIEYTDMKQELMRQFNASTIRAVKRAHVSLGHPSNAARAVAMQHAGAPAEWIQCARLFQCEICLGRQRPRAVRVAVLPRAKRFNEVVCTDVHCITWKKKARKILASIDEFTRYEVDYQISKETFLNETKLWEKLWISRAGKPEPMRMDMGGSHTAKRTRDWMSKHGIKLDLTPKGAHHRLGPMERSHAAPSATALVDPKSEVPEMMIWRTTAATALIEAKCSRAARSALLAHSRPARRNYEVGEWVYFWLSEHTQGMEKCHWYGPALAVAVEAKINEDNAMHTSATHGRAIYPCSLEQLRPELPGEAREREGRSEDPDSPLSTIEKFRRVLRRTKGTCNYRDLAEEGRLPQYDDNMDDMGEQQQPSAQAPMEVDETDGPTGAAAAAAPGDPHPTTALQRPAPARLAALRGGLAGSTSRRWHVEEAEKLDGIPLAKALACHGLTPEEKDQFYAAKLEALEAFNRNDGWEPINEDGQKVANARVLYQGFKHRDVAEGQLDRLFSADVKSAFLQAEDAGARGLKLRASPTKKIREMLSHQIGLQPGQLLKMIKPCFGDPRSPRLWRYRSDEVAEVIGLRNHKLEDYLMLSLRPARVVDDDPLDARSFEGQTYAVDGLIGRHVDDFIGRGKGATNEQDLYAKLEGATLKFEKYLHAVKPNIVEKHRRADPLSVLSPKEPTNFRTLTGQLQWRAAQGRTPCKDLLDANNANADVGLYFGFDKAWSNLRVGNYTDASWASRHDCNLQGSYAISIGPADELNAGTPAPVVAMERGSLSAEAQAAALGAESLMLVKVYLAWSLRPDLELEEVMTYLGESPFITDAKCLYDASRSATAGLGITEKRTAIE
ncbi:unnamed protein product, partial [Prorocentrum cordatum]